MVNSIGRPVVSKLMVMLVLRDSAKTRNARHSFRQNVRLVSVSTTYVSNSAGLQGERDDVNTLIGQWNP